MLPLLCKKNEYMYTMNLFIAALLALLALTVVNAHYIERAVVGGSVELSCPSQDISVDWRKYIHAETPTFVVTSDTPNIEYRNKAYLICSYDYRNLMIVNLTLADAMYYFCQDATARIYPGTKLIIVDPNVVNYIQNATIGDNVELWCPFESSKWSIFRNNKLISLHTNLINKVSLYDNGVYLCFKGNSTYSVKLVVSDLLPTTATTATTTATTATTIQPIVVKHRTTIYVGIMCVSILCNVLTIIGILLKKK